MAKKITCPSCGKDEHVDKVSTIYLAGLGLNRRGFSDSHINEGGLSNPQLIEIPAARLKALSRRLAPPSSRTQVPTRPVHPDLVVLALTLITPIFLSGIITSQAGMLLPVLAMLAGFYGFYFWKRKSMIAKFESQQRTRQEAEARIKRGIDRWMGLYYCAQDDGVFKPGEKELTPADLIAGYLFRD